MKCQSVTLEAVPGDALRRTGGRLCAPFADRWLSSEGFTCLIAFEQDEPLGHAYGAPLGVSSTWWSKVEPTPPEEFHQEMGNRTYALSELMVHAPWGGTGLAKRIVRRARVALFTHKAHPKVRAMYERWGYPPVGDAGPFEGTPELVAMVLSFC